MTSTLQTSSGDVPSGFLSSPRAQRRLSWIAAAVFLLGLVVFLAMYFRGQGSTNSPLSTVPAQVAKPQVKAPPSKAAFAVGREFIAAGVVRRNLDEAYTLVGPALKAGISRKRWDKGSTTIVPYPAGNVRTTSFQVVESYRTWMLATVDLVASAGHPDVRPHLAFFIKFVREGGTRHGRWLVNAWEPDWHPPIPAYMGG